MADGRQTKTARTGETHPSPLAFEQFRNTPEFRRFKAGMKKLLNVSKAELDKRVKRAKEISPRAGNPNAPGRRPKVHGPQKQT